MALFRKAQQGRRGGGGRGAVSSSAAARKTTPRQNKQKGAGGRSSPRLHLTQKRTQTNARRGAGVGTRVASARQQTSRARGGASTSGARRNSNTASRGGGDDGGRTAPKQAVQANGISKVVNGLKGELATATETGMDKLEAGCHAFVAAALDRCSSAISGREEEIEKAEAALRKMESREASIASPCSGMLKAIESNNVGLSAMVARCRATLDSVQQAESRKLKSSLERAMGAKS